MDVRLPDGTIIQGVPEGTSRAELIEKLRRNGYDVSKLGAPVSETPAVQQPQVPTFDPMGMPTGMTEAAPTPTPMGYSEQMEKSALSMARQAAKGATLGNYDRLSALARSTLGEVSYDQALKEEVAKTEQAAKNIGPVVSGVMSAAGTMVPATAAMRMGLSPLATFGPRVGGVGKTLLGAAEGGIWGGLQGASETYTGGLADKVAGGALGAATGAALGGALTGGFAAGSSAASALRDLYRRATGAPMSPFERLPQRGQRVMEQAAAWEGPEAAPARLSQLGPQATLADIGPSMGAIAQGATAPGPGTQALKDVLINREKARAARLLVDTEAALGRATDPLEAADLLKEARSSVGKLYPEIWENAPPVNVSGVVSKIDEMLSGTSKGSPQANALRYARDQLVASPARAGSPARREPVVDPNTGNVIRYRDVPATPPTPERYETNAERIHDAKVALQNLVDFGNIGIGVQPGAVAKKEGAVKQVLGELSDTLRSSVPGYNAVNDAFARISRQIEGVEIGTQALAGGKEAIWPERLKKLLEARGGERREQIVQGARGEIERAVGTAPNELAALRRQLGGETGFNRDKMVQLFGEDAVNRMVNAIDREQTFARTFGQVVSGSATSPRLFARDYLEETAGRTIPTSATATGLMANLAQRAVRGATQRSGMTVQNQIAQAMSLQGAERDAMMRQILESAKKRELEAQGLGLTIPGLLSQ